MAGAQSIIARISSGTRPQPVRYSFSVNSFVSSTLTGALNHAVVADHRSAPPTSNESTLVLGGLAAVLLSSSLAFTLRQRRRTT